ncbi:hypothetical protein D6D25_05364, partial [Aureobasidium pullulans]
DDDVYWSYLGLSKVVACCGRALVEHATRPAAKETLAEHLSQVAKSRDLQPTFQPPQNPPVTTTNTTNPTPSPPQMPDKVAIDQQTAQ